MDEESGDYYAFHVHNDGRYTVGKYLDGTWFVVEDDFSSAIAREGGVNLLRIEALGNWLRFFVNNTYLGHVVNGALPQGDVRLVARNVGGTEQVLAAFDDLLIAHQTGQTEPR